MERRDVIRLGSALLGLACISSVSGCSGNEENKKLSITPKQSSLYEYSYPLPFDTKTIDELFEYNKTLTKGKITTLYTSVPSPYADKIHHFFTINTRGSNKLIKTLDDFIFYFDYALKKGFKCVYALNAIMPILPDETDKLYPVITKFFKKLQMIGINDVKITNPALLKLFSEEMPSFNLHLSTCAEYHSLQNYKILLDTYPTIKSINITTDENKNFQLLSDMRKLFPDVKLEILVNETCVKYCIARCQHPASENYGFPCFEFVKNNQFLHFVRNNVVYPWDWEYYSALGINNFKFTAGARATNKTISYIKNWTQIHEKGVEGYSANDFVKIVNPYTLHFRFNDDLKLSELKKMLPDIKYFVKNGAKCNANCEANCTYCYKLAENIKKIAKTV